MVSIRSRLDALLLNRSARRTRPLLRVRRAFMPWRIHALLQRDAYQIYATHSLRVQRSAFATYVSNHQANWSNDRDPDRQFESQHAVEIGGQGHEEDRALKMHCLLEPFNRVDIETISWLVQHQ